MDFIFSLLIILATCHLFVFLGKKAKIPGVVMLIVAGLVFTITPIKDFIISGNQGIVSALGDAGLLILMFIAGLEVSVAEIDDEKRNSTILAFFSTILPILLSFAVFSALGFPALTSLMVGIAIAITAEATTADVLIGLKKMKTKAAAVIMGSGIINDMIGVLLFIVISIIFASGIGGQFIAIGAIAAFFLGIFSHRIVRRKGEKSALEKASLFLLVPFFFISVGLKFNLGSIIIGPWILVAIVAVAVIGKILGVFLTKGPTGFTNKKLLLIGWAINSGGGMQLALSLVALRIGILNEQLYSGIVVMALLTTLVFPLIITHMINKHKEIMN